MKRREPAPAPPAPSTDKAPHQPSFRTSTAQLGMVVLFSSLSVLFGSSLIAVVVTRSTAKVWDAGDISLLGLFPGTVLLLVLSAVMERARAQLAKNRQLGLQRMLWTAFALGLAFLAAQSLAFHRQFGGVMSPASDALPLFCFVLLVSLHALHVVGGLGALGLVLRRATRGDYSSSRRDGIDFAAQYFHFLGLVWLVLLGVLYAIG